MDSGSESPAAIQARAAFGMNVWSNMKDLDDLEYDTWTKWKLDVQCTLGMMDLDLALLQDQPAKPSDSSSPEEKSKHQKWERSNRMSLLFMKSKMANYIRSYVPQIDNAKEYIAGIENVVMKFEKEATRSLRSKLLRMKYDGNGNVAEHILTICSLANRLKAIDEGIPDWFLLDFVKNSLPPEFDTVNRIANDKGWNLNEVISGCSRFEKNVKDVKVFERGQ